MSSEDVVIHVRNLSKRYEIYSTPRDRLKQLIIPRLRGSMNRAGVKLGIAVRREPPRYYREFSALNDISFQVRRGETLGIIGRNGSGKSTLLQILAGTLAPTSGEAIVNGRVAALLELGSGFNPEFTGRENVFLNGQILGLSQKEIKACYDEIVKFADIGDFIDQPVKTYSSGMFVRLAFAVQAHIEASVVIIDEALAVGDIFFRQKCYARLNELRDSGAAILLVSHAMTEVEQFCDHAILLDHGKNIFWGPSTEATKRYYLQHQSAEFEQLSASADRSVTESQGLDEVDKASELWPSSTVFHAASDISQVSNGWAVCVRYAVCDIYGNARSSFVQGESAVFYYEFLLSRQIAVPLGGLVLQNARGVNVHGKGSLEYGSEAPGFLPAGSIVRCRQRVELNLEIGEYSYELGLASIDSASYRRMSELTHDELFARVFRLCHVPSAGVICVGMRDVHDGASITHHGVADLPGEFAFQFEIEASN